MGTVELVSPDGHSFDVFEALPVEDPKGGICARNIWG